MGQSTSRHAAPAEKTSPENTSSLYQCTGCGACTRACRHEVPVSDILTEARTSIASNGLAPYPSSQFEPPAYDADAQTQTPGISGHRLLAGGYVQEFKQWAAKICKLSGNRLAVSSLEDYLCIRRDWPKHGIRFTGALMLKPGELNVSHTTQETRPSVYLEPCHLQCGHSELSAVGERLQTASARLSLLRAEDDPGICCGGGGVYPSVSAEFASRAAYRVFDRAKALGAEVLVTSCGGCAKHLDSSRRPGDPEVQRLGVEDSGQP